MLKYLNEGSFSNTLRERTAPVVVLLSSTSLPSWRDNFMYQMQRHSNWWVCISAMGLNRLVSSSSIALHLTPKMVIQPRNSLQNFPSWWTVWQWTPRIYWLLVILTFIWTIYQTMIPGVSSIFWKLQISNSTYRRPDTCCRTHHRSSNNSVI